MQNESMNTKNMELVTSVGNFITSYVMNEIESKYTWFNVLPADSYGEVLPSEIRGMKLLAGINEFAGSFAEMGSTESINIPEISYNQKFENAPVKRAVAKSSTVSLLDEMIFDAKTNSVPEDIFNNQRNLLAQAVATVYNREMLNVFCYGSCSGTQASNTKGLFNNTDIRTLNLADLGYDFSTKITPKDFVSFLVENYRKLTNYALSPYKMIIPPTFKDKLNTYITNETDKEYELMNKITPVDEVTLLYKEISSTAPNGYLYIIGDQPKSMSFKFTEPRRFEDRKVGIFSETNGYAFWYSGLHILTDYCIAKVAIPDNLIYSRQEYVSMMNASMFTTTSDPVVPTSTKTTTTKAK